MSRSRGETKKTNVEGYTWDSRGSKKPTCWDSEGHVVDEDGHRKYDSTSRGRELRKLTTEVNNHLAKQAAEDEKKKKDQSSAEKDKQKDDSQSKKKKNNKKDSDDDLPSFWL